MRALLVPALGLVALGVGAWIGTGCNPCSCPPAQPFEGGTFSIIDSSDAHVQAGTVSASDQGVVLRYTDDSARTWEARWSIEERVQ